MSQVIQLTLISKPGCHLCDEAREVIQSVLAQFRAQHQGVASAVQVELRELNILEDEELLRLYVEEIPVLQIAGETHAYWRIDPIRLMDALESRVG